MQLHVIGSSMIIAIIGLTGSPSLADSQFVRELDAYCVSSEGIRQGVAASQDGATNSYVQRPGEPLELTRSVHSRRMVSLWHAELDAADFDAMEGPELDAPYCAIERVQAGKRHGVHWREGEVPEALADVFAVMLAADPNSHEAGQ